MVILKGDTTVNLEAYEQPYDDSVYVYSYGIPSMTELTMCMWLYANDGYSNEHIVSYAIDGK